MVTVQSSTVPRGVALHLQGNPEAATRQTAVFAVCVHAFTDNILLDSTFKLFPHTLFIGKGLIPAAISI